MEALSRGYDTVVNVLTVGAVSVCSVHFRSSLLPDYAVCHFLRLLQLFQPLVTSLPHGVFGHCIALDSQADQNLDQQRHSAGSSAKIYAQWLAFSRAKL